MNVLYHLTILPPPMPECVAEIQEIDALRGHFGGDLVYLNPNQYSPVYLPRLLFGFHRLRELRKREANVDLHHVYNPDLFAFPVFLSGGKPTGIQSDADFNEKFPFSAGRTPCERRQRAYHFLPFVSGKKGSMAPPEAPQLGQTILFMISRPSGREESTHSSPSGPLTRASRSP